MNTATRTETHVSKDNLRTEVTMRLHSRNEQDRIAAMYGIGHALATRTTDLVNIKAAINKIASTMLVEPDVIETSALRYIELRRDINKNARRYGMSFLSILGVSKIYNDDYIKLIDDHLPAFRAGYLFAMGMDI